MMAAEDRVAALHTRMDIRRHTKARRKTCAVGAAGVALTVCLLLLISGVGTTHRVGSAGIYSGSTMLLEGAGAYVLVAVAAFMAAVILTVSCIRWQKKNQTIRTENDNHKEENPHETP